MSNYLVTAQWEDAPHLTKEVREELLKSIPPYQRDARTKGIPQLGSGAIYQVEESFVVVQDIEIKPHWPRAFGMDVGWNRTAAVWLAKNPDTGIYYVYSEHYRGLAEPAIHADAIRVRGTWIPGFIDPAAEGRSQVDGRKLLEIYRSIGLSLSKADNSVESGIYEVWQALANGSLKFFKSCQNLIAEYRVYQRDEKGHVVKENDHLCDALRYVWVSGRDNMKIKPVPRTMGTQLRPVDPGPGSWMA